MREHFGAPWGNRLKATTAVVLAILVLAVFTVKGWAVLVILAILGLALAFAVRGYSVVAGQLLIHRLGWATRYDLAGLTSVEYSPGVTIGSARTMGIGGLFGFVGHFHNAVLGSYRAYATHEDNTVVLDFAGDKIVVTPDAPLEFVEVVESMRGDGAPSRAGEPNGAQ
jgi:hypothetical protein